MFVLIHNAIQINDCSSPRLFTESDRFLRPDYVLDCLITNAPAVASGSKWRHVVCLYLCQWYVSVGNKQRIYVSLRAISIVRT